MGTQVVWFKRDLRIEDHLPLLEASQQGPCLCLYVYEDELIHSPEFDGSHLEFINQSLQELDAELASLGGHLTVRSGNMPEVLDELAEEVTVEALWSHEETGNAITYERDLRVEKWVEQRGIRWQQFPQNGVIRRLRSRNGWSKRRAEFMKEPLAQRPLQMSFARGVESGRLRTSDDLGIASHVQGQIQAGGASEAQVTLQSFLTERGAEYSSQMSSPHTARTACSRLSTYLAWGCISPKQVSHALSERQDELRSRKRDGQPVGNWPKSLRAFESRLSWHCHFMQKLEDEPEIEFENMARAYDGLREDQFREDYFQAWCNGRTGYPMVDACMRALKEHGWINFRMRAMLVSFASYHLWLHWRPTAVFLARYFLDFEPGIHFSQFQMQSGTTGINTVRIYSPIKQVLDQDPQGHFIRKYVPELRDVPQEHLAEPHQMPLSTQDSIGCLIGRDYPSPIVEHKAAYQKARRRIYDVRKRDTSRQEAKQVLAKHGSRKSRTRSMGT